MKPRRTPLDVAFDQGKQAFENGEREGSCPFGRDDYSKRVLRESWLTGFSAARCNARPLADTSKPKTTTVVWHTVWEDMPDKDEVVIVYFRGRSGGQEVLVSTTGEATDVGTWMIHCTEYPCDRVLGWCRFPTMAKDGAA